VAAADCPSDASGLPARTAFRQPGVADLHRPRRPLLRFSNERVKCLSPALDHWITPDSFGRCVSARGVKQPVPPHERRQEVNIQPPATFGRTGPPDVSRTQVAWAALLLRRQQAPVLAETVGPGWGACHSVPPDAAMPAARTFRRVRQTAGLGFRRPMALPGDLPFSMCRFFRRKLCTTNSPEIKPSAT